VVSTCRKGQNTIKFFFEVNTLDVTAMRRRRNAYCHLGLIILADLRWEGYFKLLGFLIL
jgi:hypothetical protein